MAYHQSLHLNVDTQDANKVLLSLAVYTILKTTRALVESTARLLAVLGLLSGHALKD